MMRLLIAMVVLLFVLGLIFAPSASQESSSAEPEPRTLAVSATPVAEEAGQVGNGIAKVVIPRSEDGHFYADAQVGAATVRFLIDTGATAVALSRADAQRAGISPRAGEFTGTARTANGTVPLKPVTIDRIRIGPLEARNVAGAVIDGDLGVSLLGQSWLRQVGTVTIADDRLILN